MNFVRLGELLTIVAIGFTTTAVSEFLTWLFVHRKSDYKMLLKNISNLKKKISKHEDDNIQKQNKKKNQMEDRLQLMNSELSMKKFKSSIIVGVLMLITVSYFSKKYSGQIVAKLPFYPIALIRGLTHRGIDGTDYYECSFIFIYILSTMVVRANLQKILGTEQPPTMPFGSQNSLKKFN